MATKNAPLKVSTGVALNTTPIQTEVIHLKKDLARNPISTTAINILKVNHTNELGGNPIGFLKLNDDGSIDLSSNPSDFGASPLVHPHAITDIAKDGYDNLNVYLNDNVNGKVPLINGNIPEAYLPSYIVGHLRFKGMVDLTSNSTPATAKEISDIFTDIQSYQTQHVGEYYIVSVAGYIKTNQSSYTFMGEFLGEENALGPFHVGVGDRILFVKYNEVGEEPVSQYYSFACLRNFIGFASYGVKGTVELSTAAATDRYNLSSSAWQSNKVIDEYALKTAMRDIVYLDNIPSLQMNTVVTTNRFWWAFRAISGEPTHTSGTVAASLGYPDEIGSVYIFSTGKVYKQISYTSPTSATWEYIETISLFPTTEFENYVGEVVRFSLLDAQLFKMTNEPLYGGDLYLYVKTYLQNGDILIVT